MIDSRSKRTADDSAALDALRIQIESGDLSALAEALEIFANNVVTGSDSPAWLIGIVADHAKNCAIALRDATGRRKAGRPKGSKTRKPTHGLIRARAFFDLLYGPRRLTRSEAAKEISEQWSVKPQSVLREVDRHSERIWADIRTKNFRRSLDIVLGEMLRKTKK